MEYRTLTYAKQVNPLKPEERTIALVTLNRPARLNAITAQMALEMDALWNEVRDDPEVRAVVITGAGDGFCTGGDLKVEGEALGYVEGAEALEGVAGDYREFLLWFLNDHYHVVAQRAFKKFEDLPQPTIAAVNGWAVGAGLELCTAADIRIGSERCRLAENAMTVGFLTEWGGAWNLPKLVGPGRAMEMMFTGRAVEAAEAERIGLLNRVTPHDKLIEEALGMAGLIAAMPPMSIRRAKELVRTYLNRGYREAGMARELEAVLECARSEDAAAGRTLVPAQGSAAAAAAAPRLIWRPAKLRAGASRADIGRFRAASI
ncbi:MAG: enoyl-CoA hydratase/isomerase family protein [Candidatus Binataceae bacterium]